MAAQQLLDPKLLQSVKGLELLAKQLIDPLLYGANQSAKIGHGQEFSQYRSYEAGDDLRMLDWKLFARSDRYYVREADIESNISIRFVIDATASMQHQDHDFIKSEFARLIAATLAYLAIKQGDAISLYALNDSEISYLLPKQDRQQFYRFLYELVKIQTSGKWPPTDQISRHMHSDGRKEMIIIISDLYQSENEIKRMLKQLKSEKNEVIVIHLLGENELDLDFNDVAALEDLETGQIVHVDGLADRDDYKKRMTGYLKRMKRDLLNLNINYQMIAMNDSLDQSIRNFLKIRMNLL